jgi:hypothetical protein
VLHHGDQPSVAAGDGRRIRHDEDERGKQSVGSIERKKELKRRRHRRSKIGRLQRRVEKATASEKAVIADKLRRLSPGGQGIVARWGLDVT